MKCIQACLYLKKPLYKRWRRCLWLSIWVSLCVPGSPLSAAFDQTGPHDLDIQVIAAGLEYPWGMAFLPEGDILVTERTGRLRLISKGRLHASPVAGLPPVEQHGQGGLMGIALHPGFAENRLIYLAYAGTSLLRGYHTHVLRARFVDGRLEQVKTIFKALPKSRGGRHFGGRLLFFGDHLYITLGDRGERRRAQDLQDHAGALIRLHDDGRIPEDNPFVNQANALKEIYSFGHRNIQGIALSPDKTSVWTHEHGPQGGDEINIIKAGANYGWPVITYGVNYGTATKIGEGTHRHGMQQPLYYWTPSIAPSGMTFYTGDEFPQWKNNLLVGSLKFGLLIRLVIENHRVVHEERLLHGKYGRIRDVAQGPNGAIYLLTDSSNGALLRVRNARPEP